jgi:hypothetical protein
MKTVRITMTIKIDEEKNGLTEDHFDPSALKLLMLDAFGEFTDAREPARKYAEQRYSYLLEPGEQTTPWIEKVKSIELRNKLAHALRRSDVTVEETDEPDFEVLEMRTP